MTALVERDCTYAVDFAAIGTHIRLVTTDSVALPSARTMLAALLDDLDRAASRFRADAEISRINAASTAAHGLRDDEIIVRVSGLLAACLRAALRTEALTEGLVTPAVGQALCDAGYDDDLARVRSRAPRRRSAPPEPAPIDPARLDGQTLTLRAGTRLDLGASAKAYAADEFARLIAAEVGGGVLVDLGGDLATAGRPPRHGWRIGVADADGRTRHTVTASHNQAFATSSTQARTWTHDGRAHHHIIDPRTGLPADTRWAQITCAGPTALQANAAATAAVILGDDAIDWLTARHIPALLITTAGKRHRVGGWPLDDDTMNTAGSRR
ncbi:FAD:protein FMN transferase [Gordonia sp. NPDC003424]